MHDYYCSFLNKRIFNTRYSNYDPNDHSFKNHMVKNRKTFFRISKFHVNVNLINLPQFIKMKV